MHRLLSGLAVLALSLPLSSLAAQSGPESGVWNEVFVGSEVEEYLRLLQVGGQVPLYPWSIRGFSPREVENLVPGGTAHPWVQRYASDAETDRRGARWGVVRPRVAVIYNSAFPYGSNDGAIWAGRGITTALHAGVSARYGPLSLVLAPTVFRAQNAAFDLMPTGRSGRLVFADARNPTTIDMPQRFGDEPYARIDPGQSTLRLDLPFVTAGVSTANQHWGPASEFPILLGNHAAGFPHAFLGTSAPIDLWIGRVHGRLVWGRLDQSSYSPVGGGETRRFMSGIIGAFTPRGIPGLEVGGARFFHAEWPADGLDTDHFLKPVEGFLKTGLGTREGSDGRSDEQNQLVSAFFRWVFPGSGVELYGEFGREDHNWDLRDAILEPDHISAYMLGFRKIWVQSPQHMLAVRGELLNSRITHLAQVRNQAPFYRHSQIRQGHTHRGQTLGAPAAYGGGGSILAADWYHPGGRWTVAWSRELRWGHPDDGSTGQDVIHSLDAETLFFRGRFEVTAGLGAAYNLNRNAESDVFNLNAALGIRAGL